VPAVHEIYGTTPWKRFLIKRLRVVSPARAAGFIPAVIGLQVSRYRTTAQVCIGDTIETRAPRVKWFSPPARLRPAIAGINPAARCARLDKLTVFQQNSLSDFDS
jgi:hypothetical protein